MVDLNSNADLRLNEAIIEQNLDSGGKQTKIGEALRAIRLAKLYRAAGCKSFAVYLKTRWKRSRAWAYQLIKFVELKRVCAAVNAPLPANERQARTRWLEPNATLERLKEIDYFAQSQRVIEYLTRKFADWPPEKKAEFAQQLLRLVEGFVAKARVGNLPKE